MRWPKGIVEVVSPRAVSANVTFHQSFRNGVSASFTLPTTCVHMCTVLSVACHSAYGNAGQMSSSSARGLTINRLGRILEARAKSRRRQDAPRHALVALGHGLGTSIARDGEIGLPSEGAT